VRILGNPAQAGGGNGAHRKSLLAAGGAAQARLQSGEGEIPTGLIGDALRRDPARVAAGAVDVDEPAAAAVVGQSLDVGENAAHSQEPSARRGVLSKRPRAALYRRAVRCVPKRLESMGARVRDPFGSCPIRSRRGPPGSKTDGRGADRMEGSRGRLPRDAVATPVAMRGWAMMTSPSSTAGTVYWLRAIDPALASIVHEARIDTDRETLCALLDMPLAELQPGAYFGLEPEDVRALVQSFQLDFPVGDWPVELHPGHPNDDLPYRVHTGRELALMLAGKKPLAVFVDEHPSSADERVIPERAFEPHVASGRLVKRENLTTQLVRGQAVGVRRVLYAVSQEAWRIEAYLLLWATAEKAGWNAGFERLQGSLLGYEDWQNDIHIQRCYLPGSGDRGRD